MVSAREPALTDRPALISELLVDLTRRRASTVSCRRCQTDAVLSIGTAAALGLNSRSLQSYLSPIDCARRLRGQCSLVKQTADNEKRVERFYGVTRSPAHFYVRPSLREILLVKNTRAQNVTVVDKLLGGVKPRRPAT